MPSYEYFCVAANEEFESFHSITTVLDDCPLCAEAGRPPHAPKRLISGGSGRGIVELTGADLKAKIQSDAQQMRHDMSTNPNKLANFVGETKFNQNELNRTRR